MDNRVINGVKAEVHGEISDEELVRCLEEYQSNHETIMVRAVVTVEALHVGIMGYDANGEPFERIRRITGYLVGTTERWNNAKQAELKDRVKHGIGGSKNEQ